MFFYDKERIENLGIQFRNAIEKAQMNGERDEINYFRNFPRGCCGDTCDLLSHYLLENGISTRYVCGTFYGKTTDKFQSHAWLLYKDRVIIDITGDQFKYDVDFLYYNKCVYVGTKNDFYKLFDIEPRDIRNYIGLDARQRCLYSTISQYF